jgi:autotransporter-associated beta strand protein
VENESGSASTGTLTVNIATGSQSFSGILRNGDGAGTDGTLAFTKVGSGAQTFAGTAANTYTGVTTVTGGTLVLAKTAGVNAITGNLAIGDGTDNDIVELTNSDQIADTSVLSFNGIGANAGILRLNNQSETLVGLSSAGGAGIVENNNAAVGTSTLTVNFATGTQTFSGILRDNGGSGSGILAFTKSGSGTQELSGGNSYTGLTTVSAGTLSISHASALGTTAAGTTVTAGNLALNGGITVAGETLSLAGGGILSSASGSNAWTGNITGTGSGNALFDAITVGNDLTVSGNIANGGLTVVPRGSATITLSGNISGSGGLTRSSTGTGTAILSGANTFTGAVLISNGSISASSLNRVVGGTASSNLGAPTTAGNGTISVGTANSPTSGTLNLIYTGSGETTDRVINLGATATGTTAVLDQSGTGVLKFTSNITSAAASKTLRLQGSTAGTGEISGAIGNNSVSNITSLVKEGTGTWTLSGTNTYTGPTTVSAGALQVGNGNVGQTGSGAVTVQTSSTILGTGVIRGDTFDLQSGSTLRPGDNAADTSHGTLTFTPASASGSTSNLQGNIILGISGATTTDATFGGYALGSANYNSWLDGISGVGNHDRLVFNNPTTGTGYNLNFLTTTGSLQVVGSSFTPAMGQVFNLLDWTNMVTTNFSGFNFNSGYYVGNGDEGSDLDLPSLSDGLLWDTTRLSISGNVAIVPEPNRALLLLIGCAGVLLRRRRPSPAAPLWPGFGGS